MIEISTIASGSSGNCYLIDDGRSKLMIECGLPIKRTQEATGHRLHEVAGCLISHEHGDHAKAAKDMLRLGVDCYMSHGTADRLEITGHHRCHILYPRTKIKIGSWKVVPFEVMHDAAEPMGFILTSGKDTILFLTDSAYSPYVFAAGQKLTHLMIECNYQAEILSLNLLSGAISYAQYERIIGNHFGLDGVLCLLKANDLSQVREIHLMHLSDGNSNAEQMKAAAQGATGIPVYVCG